MKARLSLFAPDTASDKPPDIDALTAHYLDLITAMKMLVLLGDFSGVLKTSLEIGRAVKALLKGKAALAASRLKTDMLKNPHWRARVIRDLGGVKKLGQWQLAMQRAIAGQGQSAGRGPNCRALPQAQIMVRDHAKRCARACASPLITKDPFRVDQEGQFRLPPVPRMTARNKGGAGQVTKRRDYVYDPRPMPKLSGYSAPVMVWPLEFFASELSDHSPKAPRPPLFTYGPTPGRKRRPHHHKLRRRLPCLNPGFRGPARRRVFAPP